VGQIPLTDSGNVKLQYLHQWMKVRKAIECQNAFKHSINTHGIYPAIQRQTALSNSITKHGIYTGNIVECPGVTDVIVSNLLCRCSCQSPGVHFERFVLICCRSSVYCCSFGPGTRCIYFIPAISYFEI
jgi:hypothetical protein